MIELSLIDRTEHLTKVINENYVDTTFIIKSLLDYVKAIKLRSELFEKDLVFSYNQNLYLDVVDNKLVTEAVKINGNNDIAKKFYDINKKSELVNSEDYDKFLTTVSKEYMKGLRKDAKNYYKLLDQGSLTDREYYSDYDLTGKELFDKYYDFTKLSKSIQDTTVNYIITEFNKGKLLNYWGGIGNKLFDTDQSIKILRSLISNNSIFTYDVRDTVCNSLSKNMTSGAKHYPISFIREVEELLKENNLDVPSNLYIKADSIHPGTKCYVNLDAKYTFEEINSDEIFLKLSLNDVKKMDFKNVISLLNAINANKIIANGETKDKIISLVNFLEFTDLDSDLMLKFNVEDIEVNNNLKI